MTTKGDQEFEKVAGLATRSSDVTNREVYAQEERALIEQVRTLFATLRAHEEVIDRTSLLLRMSQPSMFGKLDIRWWRFSGKDYRDPVLVRWVKSRIGRPRPKKAERVAGVRDIPQFQLNAEEAMDAVGLFRSYDKKRDVLRRKLWKIKHITARLAEYEPIVRNDHMLLEFLLERVGRKLLDAGYQMDDVKLREMGLVTDDHDD